MERVITCSMCGAHCLESSSTEYEYESAAEPLYVDGVNTTEGQLAIHTLRACPACWKGVSEASK